MTQSLDRRCRKLRVRLLKRLFPYKIIVRHYAWQTWHVALRPAMSFRTATWRAVWLMHRNPYAKVWILPRGQPTPRLLRRLERFRQRIARWRFNPYANVED